MTLLFPPLPSNWPFGPRQASPPWERRAAVDLGGLGADWILVVPPDLVIPDREDPLAGAFGRGGVQRRGELVLRPYRRGGLLRWLVHSTYASPRRFEREGLVHRALWEAGFPTTRPLGYGFRRRGVGFEGVYFSAFLEGPSWPSDWPAGEAQLARLGQALRALAQWRLWAPDLNATNVLVTQGGISLLDWDRSAFVPDRDLLPLYRKRLVRSLQKLAAPVHLIGAVLAATQAEEGDCR